MQTKIKSSNLYNFLLIYLHAQVAELVYALVLGTSGAILGGSSPLLGTRKAWAKNIDIVCLCFLRRGVEGRSATVRGGVARFFSRKILVTKSSQTSPVLPPMCGKVEGTS